MIKMIGINQNSVDEKGIVLLVNSNDEVKDYWYVTSFMAFNTKYAKGEIFIDDNEENLILVYIPIQQTKGKYVKRYVNSITDVLDNVVFTYDNETNDITGVDSFCFDLSDEEVYSWLYDLKCDHSLVEFKK